MTTMIPDVTDFGYDPTLDQAAPVRAIRPRAAPRRYRVSEEL